MRLLRGRGGGWCQGQEVPEQVFGAIDEPGICDPRFGPGIGAHSPGQSTGSRNLCPYSGRFRPQLAFPTWLGANSGFGDEFESASRPRILTYENFVKTCGRFPPFF